MADVVEGDIKFAGQSQFEETNQEYFEKRYGPVETVDKNGFCIETFLDPGYVAVMEDAGYDVYSVRSVVLQARARCENQMESEHIFPPDYDGFEFSDPNAFLRETENEPEVLQRIAAGLDSVPAAHVCFCVFFFFFFFYVLWVVFCVVGKNGRSNCLCFTHQNCFSYYEGVVFFVYLII